MRHILVLFALVGFVFAVNPAAAELPAKDVLLADRVLGNDDAPVTIYDYSSLTCPHCAAFHAETLPKIKKDYIDTGKVKLIYRDFPFDRVSLMAAVMARCAPPERYYGFLDVLFRSQATWSRSPDTVGELQKLGRMGGLQPDDFKACLENEELVDTILARRIEAEKEHGFNSTPSFVVGTQKIVGNEPYDVFKQAIEDALK